MNFLLNICILCLIIPFASLSDEDDAKLTGKQDKVEGHDEDHHKNEKPKAPSEEDSAKLANKVAEQEGHDYDDHKKEKSKSLSKESEKEELHEEEDEEQKEKLKHKDPMKNKQYLAEIAAGDNADLFSTNIHKMVPPNFPDFGRRFILQYPYSEKPSSQIDDEAEERFDKMIKKALEEANQQNDEDEKLRPVKAPAYLVLAVAKQSALLQKNKPVRPDEYVLDTKALRSGDYWDAVWEEEVADPMQALRTGGSNDELVGYEDIPNHLWYIVQNSDQPYRIWSSPNLKSVKVKIMPGSKLYKLVSMARDLSPKLLYVMNDNNENK